MSSQNRSALITVIVGLVIGALVALAGSQGGATVGGVPVFALAVAAAFLVQVIVFIPSAIARTERFFDATGSATFILVTLGVVLLSPSPDARSVALAVMVIAWAARLGSFLFVRIHRSGSDDRFDEIKVHPLSFLRVWIMQGLWVSITAAAAWIAIASAPADRAAFDVFAGIGIALWVIGMAIEVIADLQKTAFKADPANAAGSSRAACGRGRATPTTSARSSRGSAWPSSPRPSSTAGSGSGSSRPSSWCCCSPA